MHVVSEFVLFPPRATKFQKHDLKTQEFRLSKVVTVAKQKVLTLDSSAQLALLSRNFSGFWIDNLFALEEDNAFEKHLNF